MYVKININSITKKFDALVNGVIENPDILMTSKIKIDDSSPTRQFLIEGFTRPYKLDRNGSGGGIYVYVREDIPSKLIYLDFSSREGFFLELNLIVKKWVLCCFYIPHNNVIEIHMDRAGKTIDSLSARYKNFILIDNFNAEAFGTITKDFCDIYSLINLIKDATCAS